MPHTRIVQIICSLIILACVGRYLYVLALLPWRPVFGAAAAGFTLAATAIAWLLLRRHPGRPAGAWWLPAAVLAGVGLCGVIPSVNTAYLNATAALPDVVTHLFSSFPEETAKLLAALLVIVVFAPVRTPVEAAVVGMAVGAGYTIAETVNNSAIAAVRDLQSDYFDGVASMIALMVLSPFAHAVYTGLAAWGLGVFLCRTDQPLGWRLSRLFGWFLLAATIHGAFNASRDFPGVAGLVASAAMTILLWVLAIWLYRRSRAIGRQSGAVDSHTSR